MRDISSALYKNELNILSEEVFPLFRDVQSLLMNSNSNRMNEVMKALKIMASFFMPITFFAGLYGMNFKHIPELGWKYSYPVILSVCAPTTISLLIYFKRKGWIGS